MYCMHSIYLGQSTWTCRKCGQGELMETSRSLSDWLCVIKYIVSDPGVSCFLPVFMKLWQVNVLACKQDKTSDSSQFLTTWSSVIEMETNFSYWEGRYVIYCKSSSNNLQTLTKGLWLWGDKWSFGPSGSQSGPSGLSNYSMFIFPVHECVIGIGFRHLAEFPHWSPDLGVRLWMTRKTKGKQLAQNLIIKQQTKYTIFLRKFKKLVPVKQTNKQNLKTQD